MKVEEKLEEIKSTIGVLEERVAETSLEEALEKENLEYEIEDISSEFTVFTVKVGEYTKNEKKKYFAFAGTGAGDSVTIKNWVFGKKPNSWVKTIKFLLELNDLKTDYQLNNISREKVEQKLCSISKTKLSKF